MARLVHQESISTAKMHVTIDSPEKREIPEFFHHVRIEIVHHYEVPVLIRTNAAVETDKRLRELSICTTVEAHTPGGRSWVILIVREQLMHTMSETISCNCRHMTASHSLLSEG